MKLLVTGASGFIGSHLVPYLIQKKHHVIGISRYKSKIPQIKKIPLDDLTKLDSLLKKEKFDAVIHLAAIIDDKDESEICDVNYNLTLNLLERCKNNKIKKFVFVSTHGVYGQTKYLPIDEDHSTKPNSNYARSKLMGEKLCKTYSDLYGMSILILRLSSVYGEGQNIKRLIPGLISKSINNKPLVIHEYRNGFQLMDMIYVKDVCNAIEQAIHSNCYFDIFNIASGKALTVKEIIKKFSKTQKIQIKQIKKEANHFLYDVSKANKKLDFRPKHALNKEMIVKLIHDIKKRN